MANRGGREMGPKLPTHDIERPLSEGGKLELKTSD